jgi:hypothetical protein
VLDIFELVRREEKNKKRKLKREYKLIIGCQSLEL